MENKKTKKILGVNRFKTLCTLPLFLFPVTELSAESLYAQTVQFSFSVSNSTVKEVLNKIEDESEFVFVYYEDTFDPSQKVTVDAKGKEINEILDEVFAGKGVSYEINDRQVVLKKNAPVNAVKQQDKRTIKGIVRDKNGEAIIGANVLVKGTTTGVITDIMGEYQVSASRGDVLVVSFIGYKTQEVTIGRDNTINIMLQEDTEVLEEVVVTAFGTGQKKETMVGAIQTVRPDDLKIPASNLSTAFAGRLAGVIAVQRTGEPGADGANFWIRGVSTFGGSSTSPLIIIDGVESESRDLNALDPEVIEGFSVLKDATATAMYGMRGANGVMIVTTKSGDALSKPIINFRIEGSMSTPTHVPEFVDGATFMELYNEGLYNNPTGKEPYTQERIDGVRNGLNPYVFPNVDWYDELFKDRSFSETVNFNIRGGSKKVDYFSSISVFHEDGMLKDRSKEFFSYSNNINRWRYSFQNNINAHLSNTSKLSLKLNVQLVDKRTPKSSVSSLYSSVMDTNPVDAPIMYPDDGVTEYIKWGVRSNTTNNPLASLVSGYNDTFQSTVIASLNFDQKLDFITKGLSFKAMASFKTFSQSIHSRNSSWNRFSLDNWSVNPDGTYNMELVQEGEEVNTQLKSSSSNSGNRRIYFQALFDYNRKFGKHDVGALFIYNQDEYVNSFASEVLLEALPQRRQGIAARASYSYDNRYMAEVNLGYNGSENFAANNRWGFFPSFAVGYNISEEKFFEPLKDIVSRMKIRASYGLVGNGDIGGERFAYLPSLELTGSPSFVTGIDMNYSLKGPKYIRFANNDLTWEIGKKYNVGVDFTFLRNLNFTVEFFREDRSNIFQKKAVIPSYMGTYGTTYYVNNGAVTNQGVDASLDFGHQFNKDLSMTFKGTFTYAHNEITAYEEAIGDYDNLSHIGMSVSQELGYISDYLFADMDEINNSPTQLIGGPMGAGDIKYVNQPNKYGEYDNVIDANDRVALGYPTTPEIVYGFGPSIQYKGFDISLFFQGVGRTSLFLSDLQPFGNVKVNRNVQTFIAENRWSPDNQDIRASYPRLTIEDSPNNSATSDYWMRDGSFLKLKNAEIGYTYKNMRFYLRGSNLLTFSKFDLWDPEQGGGNGLKYPTQRVFNFGFQMTIK